MAKWFHVLIAGVAATAMASLVGCSQAPDHKAAKSSAQPSAASSPSASTTAQGGKSNYRLVKDITPPAPGADPLAMVMQLRKPTEEAGEQIKVSYPSADRAVVITTASGLKDDSISALRTRYDFQSDSSSGSKLWKIVQVTQQNKCQSGRGSQQWTGDMCQ